MSAVLCTWDPSPTQPVDGYNVYITKDGVTTKVNSSLIKVTQYKITNLSPGTYSVAYDTAVRGQRESDPSNTVSFTIEFDSKYKPSNLQSTVDTSDVTFSWDYVPGVTQYNVYLKTGAGSFVLQDTVNSNRYEITGLASEDYEWYIASVYNNDEADSDTKTFTIA